MARLFEYEGKKYLKEDETLETLLDLDGEVILWPRKY